MRRSSAGRCIVGFHMAAATVFLGALTLASGCGFGHYNDEATPLVTSANDGVSGDGQWWPWACANGSSPSPATAPLSYTAAGTCGTGGAFTLSVDGCAMLGDWDSLGLSSVSTSISSSIPAAGGWEITGTGIGGNAWTCDAVAATSKVLTLTCTAGTPAATVCTSTLTPVTSP